MSPADRFDYALIGGGLQSGLIALALRARAPGARIAIVERESRLGGNHTWCFYRSDPPPESLDWIDPLVEHHWTGSSVTFPDFERTMTEPYSAITSERFHRVVTDSLGEESGSRLYMGRTAVRCSEGAAVLDDGTEVRAELVCDARGPGIESGGVAPAGYQKFLGLELELEEPHGMDRPVVMDANVEQSEGFRFFYVLPLSPDRVLVEDTYFHGSQALDTEAVRDHVLNYARKKSLVVRRVLREERGVLPMPWSDTTPRDGSGALAVGYRGGWFHPATGYSFPVAARVAEYIAGRDRETIRREGLRGLEREFRSNARFCFFLNDLLFRWYAPENRRNVFARFYRLPIETIQRFYALRLRWIDRYRLLVGNPPRGFSPRYRFGSRTR